MAKKQLSRSEAKTRAEKYCAYQERSQVEVRRKLWEWGIYGDEAEEVLYELITSNFINEERFAVAYAGGKFRIKKWGRKKILQGLEQHQLSSYCIKKAMKEVPQSEYENTLRQLLDKKSRLLSESDVFLRNHKLARYAISRGYEPDLVWRMLNEET